MKICVDARTLFFRGGVGVYTRNLLPELVAGAPEVEFEALISSRHVVADVPFSFPNLKVYVSSAEWEAEDGMKVFADEAGASGADVCFMTFCLEPVEMTVPLAITLHDVIPAVHPEYFTKEIAEKFSRGRIAGALGSAARIVCDSACTMRDAERLFDVPAGKMSVAYPGVSGMFRPYTEAGAARVLGEYGLDYRGFILFTGVVEPRKNVGGLIRAYEGRRALRGRGLKLVVAGKKGWDVDDVYAYVDKKGLGDDVKLLDYVSDDDLPALTGSAAVFAYPSFYEGFGLPVVEAMASGAPVVASGVSSIPEVAGDAAVLVDPASAEEIGAALERVVLDEKFANALRAAGLERAKYFSWKRTAEEINAIISSLGGG